MRLGLAEHAFKCNVRGYGVTPAADCSALLDCLIKRFKRADCDSVRNAVYHRYDGD